MSNNNGKKKTGLYIIIGILVICSIIAAFLIGKGIHTSKEDENGIEDKTSIDTTDSVLTENDTTVTETLPVEIPQNENKTSSGISVTKSNVTDRIKAQNQDQSEATTIDEGLTLITKNKDVEKDEQEDGELTIIE